jgi:hypothetical protein
MSFSLDAPTLLMRRRKTFYDRESGVKKFESEDKKHRPIF